MYRFYGLLLLALIFSIATSAQDSDSDSKHLHIRQITFAGNKVTKPFVIEREMSIKAGDSIKASALNDIVEYNRERILNSQLFVEAEGNIKNWQNDSIDIEYTLKELFYWNAHPYVTLADRNFNVWWYEYNHKFSRLNLGADINRKNFRGRGEEIGIEGQIGFNKHVYIYYANPYIDKTLKNGIKASISFNTGKEIHSGTDSNKQVFYRDENINPYHWFRGEFSYLFRPKYAAIHELRLAYHRYKLADKMFAESSDYLGGRQQMGIPEIMYRYKFNNADDRNYPMDGWELDGFIEHKGMGLVKDFMQTQVYAHVARFQPITPKLSAAFHFRGRIYGPDKQPYFNYRAMGFENDYVRGYEYYIVDGSHYALFRTDLRRKLFSYKVKQHILPFLRYVPVDFYAKTYGDLGYVHSNNFGNSFLNNKLLTGYGLGLDIVMSYYVKVRLEYSFNGLGEKGLFLNLRNE